MSMSQELERLREEFEVWWRESFGNVTVVYPEELAMVLRKEKSAVYRAIKRGEIPVWRLGRSYLLLKPGLWRWWRETRRGVDRREEGGPS